MAGERRERHGGGGVGVGGEGGIGVNGTAVMTPHAQFHAQQR